MIIKQEMMQEGTIASTSLQGDVSRESRGACGKEGGETGSGSRLSENRSPSFPRWIAGETDTTISPSPAQAFIRGRRNGMVKLARRSPSDRASTPNRNIQAYIFYSALLVFFRLTALAAT
jgi:hypothetical protein